MEWETGSRWDSGESFERERLAWLERLFALRKKYRGTPPGYRDEEAEQRDSLLLARIRRAYEEKQRYRLGGAYRLPEECFVGRESYLARIREIFAGRRGPAVLCGIGGIGKTAIARAYARRYQGEYDAVLFLTCDTDFQSLLCDDVRLPILPLCYSRNKYGSKRQYFREKMRVLEKLAGESRILLILDDCNREQDPRMAEVFSLPCDLLITTRRDPASWGSLETLPVRGITETGEWEAFVRTCRGREPSREEWEELRAYRDQVSGHTLLMLFKISGGG